MTNADGRRWTRRFLVILAATLVAQLALPLITVMGVMSSAGRHNDGMGGVLIVVLLTFMRGIVPAIGMTVLMISALRRARAIGEGWLIRTLIVLASLGSITFYSMLIVANPLERIYGFFTLFMISFCNSAMPLLIILCLSLRRPQAWNPHHRTPAMAIAAVATLAMAPMAIAGITTAVMPLGFLMGSRFLLSLVGAATGGASVYSSDGAMRSCIYLLIAAGLWWTMLIDDDMPSTSRLARPKVAAAVLVVMLVLAWQTISSRSLLVRLTRPAPASFMDQVTEERRTGTMP